jgi:hypothetical protein
MQQSRPTPQKTDRETRIYPSWVFGLLSIAVLLHLNYWLWGADRLVFGLPINLLYHVLLTILLVGFMRTIVRRGWPSFLEAEDGE